MKKNTSVFELFLFPNRILIFSLGITFLVSCFLTFQNQSPFELLQEADSSPKIIASDGLGYYSPLPALLFEHSLNYVHLTHYYWTAPWNKAWRTPIGERELNKYSWGPALLWSPFFIIGIGISWILNMPLVGNSPVFDWMIQWAGLFYLFIGLYFSFQLTHGSKLIRWVFLAGTILATPLFYYSIFEPSMSHVLGFAMTSIWLYYLNKKDNSTTPSLFVWLSWGLLLSIRLSHLLWLPLFWILPNNHNTFLEKFLQTLKASSIGILVYGIQVLKGYAECGMWVWKPYPDEGFYGFDPQVTEFLFGIRKGMFVYSPWVLPLFISLYLWSYKEWKPRLIWIGSLSLIVYVYAAWWNPGYGDGFGQRILCDVLPVWIWGGSSAFQAYSWKGKTPLFIGFTAICATLSLFQVWQYRVGILPHSGNTSGSYLATFLKTDYVRSGCMLGAGEYPYYIPEGAWKWNGPKDCTRNELSLPVEPIEIVPEDLYAQTSVLDIRKYKSKSLYVKFKYKFISESLGNSKDIFRVVEILDTSGKTSQYMAMRLSPVCSPEYGHPYIHEHSWNYFKLPENAQFLKTYYWNPNQQKIKIQKE